MDILTDVTVHSINGKPVDHSTVQGLLKVGKAAQFIDKRVMLLMPGLAYEVDLDELLHSLSQATNYSRQILAPAGQPKPAAPVEAKPVNEPMMTEAIASAELTEHFDHKPPDEKRKTREEVIEEINTENAAPDNEDELYFGPPLDTKKPSSSVTKKPKLKKGIQKHARKKAAAKKKTTGGKGGKRAKPAGAKSV